MGNPPYLGSKLQDAIQKDDMKVALSDVKDKKGVDYIAAWFWKGAKYIKESKAKYAFVTTNSISQGEQVAMLWKPIFDLGLEIFYTFVESKVFSRFNSLFDGLNGLCFISFIIVIGFVQLVVD